jgi:hypothetical protein
MRALVHTAAVLIAAIGTGLPTDSAADPTTDRVFTAPTAWLAPEHAVVATGAVDLRAVADGRLEGTLVVGYGLGGVAQLDLGTDADVRGCNLCRAANALPLPLYLGRASFRMGVAQDRWFRGQPALLVGTRVSFASGGPFDDLRVVDTYAVASRSLFEKTSALRLHAGVHVIDAGFEAPQGRVDITPAVRPTAGIEWTPPQYPRTSLMGDVAYLPLLEATDTEQVVKLEWVAGWGVRYQAFAWGAIELAVRHREDEGIGDSTVFVRINGVRRLSR